MVGTLAHPPQSELCLLLSTVLRFWRAVEPKSHVCPLYPSALCLTGSKWFQGAWLKAWLTEGNFLPEIPGENLVEDEEGMSVVRSWKQDQDQEREMSGGLLGQRRGSTWGLWADGDIQ